MDSAVEPGLTLSLFLAVSPCSFPESPFTLISRFISAFIGIFRF